MAPLKYHSIRYVTADQFNDPYDCKCFFENIDNTREDSLSEVINRHLRVACMSRNPSSPIMWSHYSTHHAGYVLEYNLPDLTPRKVDYKELKPFHFSSKMLKEAVLNKKPDISGSEIQDYLKEILISDEFYIQLLADSIFTKHIDWKYEQEYRFIDVNEKGSSEKYVDKDIGPENVNSIILGYKFNHDKFEGELKRIIDSVYDGKMTVYKAEPSFDEYSMKIKRYTIR
ncbi:hypothetical protein KMU_05950 [Proteus vulgaris]|uniref:DUF2971 domain-containing protein n=1 Tax=Proteus vulgaris TaxID=585 RepID=UPI0025566A0F|nr:DUF2971 domain-containing protein [Proteus vulgaris]GLX62555.1 hypothetical protein KMU_05950 [Proteus vulgaris]